jgi:hypothetical protein
MKMPTTTTTTKQSLEPVELRSRLKTVTVEKNTALESNKQFDATLMQLDTTRRYLTRLDATRLDSKQLNAT